MAVGFTLSGADSQHVTIGSYRIRNKDQKPAKHDKAIQLTSKIPYQILKFSRGRIKIEMCSLPHCIGSNVCSALCSFTRNSLAVAPFSLFSFVHLLAQAAFLRRYCSPNQLPLC